MNRITLLLLTLLSLGSCADKEVRYDPAPAPIDIGRYSALVETTCGGKGPVLGFGQGACSFGFDEVPSGTLRIYTPLPGAIHMWSRNCGVDEAAFHDTLGGPFEYDLGKIFGKIPPEIRACSVQIDIEWQLPPKMKSSYPLKGIQGRLYYRRRPPASGAPKLDWVPSLKNRGQMEGLAFAQFRSISLPSPTSDEPFPTGEPLRLKVDLGGKAKTGKFYMEGCGKVIPVTEFSDKTELVFTREQLIGEAPKAKERCILFGWAKGEYENGDMFDHDVVVGTEVFDYRALKLSGSVTVDEQQICYAAEDTVTACVLNYNGENKFSTELRQCWNKVEGVDKYRLGCWTHKGRAVYATVDGSEVDYIH